MQSESLLPSLQDAAAGHYPEPEKSNLNSRTLYMWYSSLLLLLHSAPRPNKCISYLKISYLNSVYFVHFLRLLSICSIAHIFYFYRFDHPIETNLFVSTFNKETAQSYEIFSSTKFR